MTVMTVMTQIRSGGRGLSGVGGGCRIANGSWQVPQTAVYLFVGTEWHKLASNVPGAPLPRT